MCFTIFGDAYSRVNFFFDLLELAFLLHKVPVCWLGCFVGNFFWFLMGFSIVILVKHIRVIYRQVSRLLLSHTTFLVLIDLNLLLDFIECTCIHLCRCHKSPHLTFELDFLYFFGRQVFVLLFYLNLYIFGKLFHI